MQKTLLISAASFLLLFLVSFSYERFIGIRSRRRYYIKCLFLALLMIPAFPIFYGFTFFRPLDDSAPSILIWLYDWLPLMFAISIAYPGGILFSSYLKERKLLKTAGKTIESIMDSSKKRAGL